MKFSKKERLLYFLTAILMFGVPFFINTSSLSGKPPQILQPIVSGEKINPFQPRLIYFWAEWCGICRMMQAPISAVLTDYPGLTIAVKSGNDRLVKNYLSKHGLNWVTVNDKQGEVAHQYGIQGVPAVFILDSKGEIAFSTSGYSSELGLRFRLWLAGIE